MKNKSNDDIQPIITNQPFEDNKETVVEKDPLAYYPSNRQKNSPYLMSYQSAVAKIPTIAEGNKTQNDTYSDKETVTSYLSQPSVYAESKSGKTKKKKDKNKKPMKKGKKVTLIIIVTILILAILGGGFYALWIFVLNKPDKFTVDFDNVKVYMADDFFIGDRIYKGSSFDNTFDLKNFFDKGDRQFAISEAEGKATLSGSTLTISQIGNFKLTVTESEAKTYKVTVLDAVNVFSMAELRKAIVSETDAVLQKDIKSDNENITLKSNLYGNGHNLIVRDANVTGGDLGSFIDVKGEGVIIQDLQLTGRKLTDEEAKNFKLEEFDHYGYLVSVSGDENQNLSATIKNCVLENAERLIFSKNADIKIEGCILQNAADACVSIETHTVGASNITVKNSIIRNAIVAGILCWGFTPGVTEEQANNIYLEGFVDIYNFKERENVQIVPRKEGVSGLANPMILKEIKKTKYNEFFYQYDKKEYIHFGIVIMCSGTNTSENLSKLYDNGKLVNSDKTPSSKIGYVKRIMPTGPAGALALKQCDIYGYDKKPLFEPDQGPNKNIFEELRNGRK